MNIKFYLKKMIAALSIALCSTNCLSFAKIKPNVPKKIKQIRMEIVMPNPVSMLSEEEALKIAEDLGPGKSMGSWKTMSGEEFMKWWRSYHEEDRPVSLINFRTNETIVEVNGLSYFIDDVNSCAKVVGLSKQYNLVSFNEFSRNPIRVESSVLYDGKYYSVTSIEDSCFEGCSNFDSIIIPNSIEKIGTKSFAGSSLKYVVFENDSNLTSIRESAFENSSIEFIVLPKSLEFVDRSAFSNCENLSILMIENPDINVSADSFNNCKNL